MQELKMALRINDVVPNLNLVTDKGNFKLHDFIGKLQLSMTYPMSVGRNFAEVIRSLDALQATYGVPIATPADWLPGEDVIAALSLSDEQAKARFGELDVVLPYLRKVAQPK